MTYRDSEKVIHVGDCVFYAGARGRVVFIVDDDEYSKDYPKEGYSYLGKGIGVEIDDPSRTLFHLEIPDEDLSPAA